MKVCIVGTWRGAAFHNLALPLHEQLGKMGVESTYLTLDGIKHIPDFDYSFSEYDILHLMYFDCLRRDEFKGIEVPFTCGIHHMPPHKVPSYTAVIFGGKPDAIVVPEPFVRRQLGQSGVYNVYEIPYAFNHDKWPHMPPPKEFTVGYLGCDNNVKRFTVIEEACALAGVPHVDLARYTLMDRENYAPDEDVLATYRNMSCYVVASFNDGGPLPPQEALLCGRPVVTTHVGMMPQVVREGCNGEFHDGSAIDMARAIKHVKANYDKYYGFIERNREDMLPKIEDVATRWVKMWEDVLETVA